MRVKDAVGRFGETVACHHVESLGMRIVDRNWRCPEGELDIVAVDGRELVVIEVKTRSTSAFGSPAEAVGRTKAARLRRLAARWADEHRTGTERGDRFADGWSSIRIDVIAVVRSPHGRPDVEHFVGAV